MSERIFSPEALREVLEAEKRLATLAVAEDFARLWETETYPALKNHFALQYRKLMGVEPSQRDEFASGLQRIRETGEGTVSCLIALFNQKDPVPVRARG